jgi:hypothetical protein
MWPFPTPNEIAPHAIAFARMMFARAALIAYCRHACRSRLLEIQIAQFELEWTRTEGGHGKVVVSIKDP